MNNTIIQSQKPKSSQAKNSVIAISPFVTDGCFRQLYYGTGSPQKTPCPPADNIYHCILVCRCSSLSHPGKLQCTLTYLHTVPRCSSLSHPGKLQSIIPNPLFLQGFSLFPRKKTRDSRRVIPAVSSLFPLAL